MTLTHDDLKTILAIGADLAHLEDALAIAARSCRRCPTLPGVAELQNTLAEFSSRLAAVNLIGRLLPRGGPIDRNRGADGEQIDLSAEANRLEPDSD